jgi:hypothetical protein
MSVECVVRSTVVFPVHGDYCSACMNRSAAAARRQSNQKREKATKANRGVEIRRPLKSRDFRAIPASPFSLRLAFFFFAVGCVLTVPTARQNLLLLGFWMGIWGWGDLSHLAFPLSLERE